LSITDRKKELLKTSGGKMIAPQPIENKLKANVLVGQAALVGDKHKFACVLISPNFAALEGWAEGQGITAGDRAALVKDAKVVKAYQEIVDKVNIGLANYEHEADERGSGGVGVERSADAEHEAEATGGGAEYAKESNMWMRRFLRKA
jgi:long-subunit acyl-CoA synthetase (AMP-forming)